MLFAGAMVADRLTVSRNMFAGLEASVAVIDLLLTFALAVLTIKRPQLWLAALTATQAIACLGHITKLVGLQNSRLTYAILTGSGAYPALIILLWGLWSAIESRKQQPRGPDH
ncbi:hypothetical protein FPZ24_01880 [Sphingomonas panacisoli]|uniref:Uncharacterized protein n=2 Tax=Sphingomonas panacisoli TaxID=1813879 RepID=A0A5B8LE79_9SPHN|nr:hypothetical protein FPZ24_01880 [Sphingomonas panacisoli]